MLRARALHLPKRDWGRSDVTEADVSFDEPGEPKTGARCVPIPRQLVDLLQAWVDQHGFGPDDLLFRTRTGRRPTSSNWSRALQRALGQVGHAPLRSEEHTSELQSLMRIPYAVFCLNKNN